MQNIDVSGENMLCATGEEQPNQSTRRFLNFVAQQESD